MKKVLVVLFLGFYFLNVSAQVILPDNNNGLYQTDSTSFNGQTDIKLSGKTKYTDFRLFSIANDTAIIDTTLTLQKDFKFNYLRKDNFELLPFHNQGQTFNKLGYNFEQNSLFPAMGMEAKQYHYYSIEDIKYYKVPTPTSEFMYRTGLEQGQVLDALLTMNTSPRFNFSLAYKGLRSLGNYRQSLSSHGNFRGTFNYHSEDKTYYLKGHFYSFDFLNEENGGLIQESIDYFEANDPNYTDRGRLEVNFTDGESMYEGKRYYINQSLTLFSKKNQLTKKHLKSELLIAQKKADSIKKIQAIKIADSLHRDSLNLLLATKELTAIDFSAKDSLPIISKDTLTELNSNNVALDSIIKPKDSILVKTPETIIALQDTLKPTSKKELTATNLKPIDSINKKDKIFELEQKKALALNKTKPDSVKDSTEVKISKLDSIKNIKDNLVIKLGHTFMYETKHYRFSKTSSGSYFGDSFESSISDHTSYQNMENQLYFELYTPYTGTLRAKANHYKYNYHYNSILYLDTLTISDKLKGNVFSAGADWNATIGNLNINADATSIISGDLTGNSLKASVNYKKDSTFSIKGYAEVASKSPSFNKILFQSAYKDYNWSNDFKNEEIKNVGFEFKLNKWGSVNASYNLVDNFTYFDTISSPTQAKETLNYVKVKANQYFTYRNFTIDNTVMYQNVLEGESFFRVPQIVTRNTLYYSNYVFKGKPLYLQTGVTFKYFTAFNLNAFDPLLNEFVLQDDIEIGNYPIFDFFLNMQVRRTRIFFKVENFGASFTGRNYYSAPNYPYRDLTIRFGLVWNFFI
ncbi:putative porin [Lutibacter sp. A80]|uniref:putative porin n=1 Tax=Lutibacter sp. A80 TaxID=2918453 RepID=UPI001F06511E|nr:putative porin [Lutibacter sp. A80]UMB60135.1 putative porin [Lutibacter sp. A80]